MLSCFEDSWPLLLYSSDIDYRHGVQWDGEKQLSVENIAVLLRLRKMSRKEEKEPGLLTGSPHNISLS